MTDRNASLFFESPSEYELFSYSQSDQVTKIYYANHVNYANYVYRANYAT